MWALGMPLGTVILLVVLFCVFVLRGLTNDGAIIRQWTDRKIQTAPPNFNFEFSTTTRNSPNSVLKIIQATAAVQGAE